MDQKINKNKDILILNKLDFFFHVFYYVITPCFVNILFLHMNLVLNNYILYIKKKLKNKENLTVNKLDFFRHF